MDHMMVRQLLKNHLLAADIRNKTIELSCKTGAGHLAPALSTVEILTVLFRDFLNFNQANPRDETRDRFILSKGHGCYAYYVILNKLGLIPDRELENFYTDQSTLTGCLSMNLDYMIEASTGSLGHGLPIAVGMAMSFKIQGKANRVVCMVGDGEMQEGSNFEALQFACHHKLGNLLVIVDANGLQAMDKVADVALDNDKLAKILKVYAESHFFDIDGHDEHQITSAMKVFFDRHAQKKEFTIVYCRTVKGKGIDFMENKAMYHFRCPSEDGYVLCSTEAE
jgi:transketolase